MLVYGTRMYGRFDEVDGENLTIPFAHILGFPLVPETPWWLGAGDFNHRTRTSWRGLFSVYARWWGTPLAALLLWQHVWITGLIVAGTAAAGFGLTSMWRWLSPSRRREAMFNRAAFGTCCDPDRRTPMGRARLQVLLSAAHERRVPARPLEDIVASGAMDADEAVIAYGLLRLAGKSNEALKVLRGDVDPAAATGPYREPAAMTGEREKDGDGLLGLDEEALRDQVVDAMTDAVAKRGFPGSELALVLVGTLCWAAYSYSSMDELFRPRADREPWLVVVGGAAGLVYAWNGWRKLVIARRAKT